MSIPTKLFHLIGIIDQGRISEGRSLCKYTFYVWDTEGADVSCQNKAGVHKARTKDNGIVYEDVEFSVASREGRKTEDGKGDEQNNNGW